MPLGSNFPSKFCLNTTAVFGSYAQEFTLATKFINLLTQSGRETNNIE